MMMMKPLKRRSSDSNNKPTVKAKAPNQPSPSSKTSEASELEMLRAKVAMLESQLKENSNVAQVTALPDGGSDSSSEDEGSGTVGGSAENDKGSGECGNGEDDSGGKGQRQSRGKARKEGWKERLKEGREIREGR